MANEARLKIVIDALNLAKGELGMLEKELGGVQGATQKAAQANTGFKGTWTELSSALGIAKQAYQAVDQVLQATVGETVAYAAQIRELSRTIGSTAEQSSILIQAADDVGISAGTIQTAMESAIRKGVRPTIDGLAELSTQYKAIQDPIEKTEFLMKNFGRAGADLAPLMKLGADGLREAGQAAKESGLVMSGEAVQAAREYEVAMDNLGDAVTGVKYKIGNTLIPTLTDATNSFMLLATMNDKINAAYGEQSNQLATTSKSWEDYTLAMQKFAGTQNAVIDNSGNLVKLFGEGEVQTEELIRSHFALSRAEFDAAKGLQELGGATVDADREAQRYIGTMKTQADATQTTKLAQDELKASMATLSLTIGGPLRRETENFTNQQADLARQSDDLRGKIAALESQRWMTDAQRAQLDEYKIKLGEVNLAVTANAQAHDEATKRILFDLLSQRAAVDGLTSDELKGLTEIALQWGLVDRQTATSVANIDTALGTLATSGNIDAFVAGIGEIAAAARDAERAIAGMGMSGSDMPSGYRQAIPQASGGDWMVNRPTLFMAGEAGPERATFTPQRGTSSNTNYHNNSNVTIQVTDTLAAAYIVDQARRGRLGRAAGAM